MKHVPEKHRDRAPRLTHLSGGRGDAWLVEGQPILHVGSNISGTGTFKFAYASYTTEEGSPTPGTGDAVQRLREQDHDGIDAEVLFPPVHISRFIEGIGDKDVYVSVVQAYNTFLAEDFCSVAPDRLIGAAFMPVSGIRDAVEELERAKRLGLKAVTLRQFPNGTGKAAPEDDQFWERALELGMALSPHINFGDPGPAPTVRHDKLLYPPAAGMGSHVASAPTSRTNLGSAQPRGVRDGVGPLRGALRGTRGGSHHRYPPNRTIARMHLSPVGASTGYERSRAFPCRALCARTAVRVPMERIS